MGQASCDTLNGTQIHIPVLSNAKQTPFVRFEFAEEEGSPVFHYELLSCVFYPAAQKQPRLLPVRTNRWDGAELSSNFAELQRSFFNFIERRIERSNFSGSLNRSTSKMKRMPKLLVDRRETGEKKRGNRKKNTKRTLRT